MSNGFVSTVAISESKNCPQESSEQCKLSKSSLYKFLSSSVMIFSIGAIVFWIGIVVLRNVGHNDAESICVVDSLLCSEIEINKKRASVETSLDGHFFGEEMLIGSCF